MIKRCYKKACKFEADYVCLCLCSESYCCEFHLQAHLELPNKAHVFESIPGELYEWNKAAALEFLIKEKSKKEKLKKIALASFNQNFHEFLREWDFDLKEINSLIERISQYSAKNEDSPLNQSILQPNPDTGSNSILLKDSDPYNNIKLFCRLRQIKYKRFLILNKAKNDPETEQNFRKACLLYENNTSYTLLSQNCQEYISSYQKITSTFLIGDDPLSPNLFIYDTESGREEKKNLKISEKFELSYEFIIPLPNNELFVYGKYGFIIDKNYKVRNLQPKWPGKCFTAIYYNRTVYCFGDKDYKYPSRRFNLDKNRWYTIASLPKSKYDDSNNIIFNRNILISGKSTSKLLVFSIIINSFSKIPYKFEKEKRKILINTEERVYLIECGENSWIYESEIGNEYFWKKIKNSMIDDFSRQVYCSYNNGGIYISILYYKHFREYLKFDLDKKTITEIACYSDNLALKREGDNLETIECYGQNLKLNSDYAAAYINKGWTLYYIAKSLELIESYNKLIENNPKNWDAYLNKGIELHNLGKYTEATRFYNIAIKIKPDFYKIYSTKGNSLYKLKRYREAVGCYNESIELQCCDPDVYFYEGKALHKINRDIEAMQYYNEAIKLNPNNHLYFCYRAKLLNDVGHEEEALNDFNKAYEMASSCTRYNYTCRTAFKDWLELLKIVCNLQESVVEFKDELEKSKDMNFNNQEILNEIGEKETTAKEQHSEILKKAVKCLSRKYQSSEAIAKIKKEVIEHQEIITDIVTQLSDCWRAAYFINED